MELRPEDIPDRQFLSAIAGFDRQEVRLFLAAVAAQLEEKNREVAQLKRRVRSLEASSAETEQTPPFDGGLLVDLQNQIGALVVELHKLLNDALSLVSELREAKRESSSMTEPTPIAEPTSITEPEPAPEPDVGELRAIPEPIAEPDPVIAPERVVMPEPDTIGELPAIPDPVAEPELVMGAEPDPMPEPSETTAPEPGLTPDVAVVEPVEPFVPTPADGFGPPDTTQEAIDAPSESPEPPRVPIPPSAEPPPDWEDLLAEPSPRNNSGH